MARKKVYDEDGYEVRDKVKKPFYKKWWFWILAFIIIGGTFGGGDEENPESNTENTASDSIASSEIESTEETYESEENSESEAESNSEVIAEDVYDTAFEKNAHDVFGDNLREFEHIENEGKILITTYVPGNITENMMKRSFHMSVIEYAKNIQDEDFVDFYIDGEASMTDQYGNTEDSKVFTIGLNKETVDKINFDSFITDNLESIADAVFVHPSFLD